MAEETLRSKMKKMFKEDDKRMNSPEAKRIQGLARVYQLAGFTKTEIATFLKDVEDGKTPSFPGRFQGLIKK